jgi:hypothetical protein
VVEQLLNIGIKNSTLERPGPWPAIMLTVGSPSVVQLYCRIVEEFSHVISCAKYKVSIEYSFILNYLLYSTALLVI